MLPAWRDDDDDDDEERKNQTRMQDKNDAKYIPPTRKYFETQKVEEEKAQWEKRGKKKLQG